MIDVKITQIPQQERRYKAHLHFLKRQESSAGISLTTARMKCARKRENRNWQKEMQKGNCKSLWKGCSSRICHKLENKSSVIENIQNLRLLWGDSRGSNPSNSVCSLTYPKYQTTDFDTFGQHFGELLLVTPHWKTFFLGSFWYCRMFFETFLLLGELLRNHIYPGCVLVVVSVKVQKQMQFLKNKK